MIRGPALEAGHIGLTTEQPGESQGRKGMVRVADPASLPRVIDLAKGRRIGR